MSAKRFSRREFLSLAGAAGGAALLAACAPKPTETPETPKEETPGEAPEAEEIHILFMAGVATPTAPDEEVPPGEVRKVAMQHVVDAYMDEHPNVTIEFYRFPGAYEELNEWMIARMTAQDMPDIWSMDAQWLWPFVGKGWFWKFDEWLEDPNPYQPKYARWKDQFEQVALWSQIGPDGHTYGVAMDGASIVLVYNKDHFAEAGVEGELRTWNEFMEAWKKVQANGHSAFGVSRRFHWHMGMVYSQGELDDLLALDEDENNFVDSREFCVAWQKGEFPDWDAWLQSLKLMKEMAQFCPKGFESGEMDMHPLFRAGEVSMFMMGCWAQGQYLQSPPPFELGYTMYPIITKDVWSSAMEKQPALKGAWAELQYHIPAFLSEKAPEKLPWLEDFIMFICQPDYVSSIIAEYGMLPLIKEARAKPELEPFMAPFDYATPYQGWMGLSQSALNAERKIGIEYMSSDMSDDEILAKGKETIEVEVNKVLESNPDWKL